MYVIVWIEEISKLRSIPLPSNSGHRKMVQCKVEWFSRETNGLRHTQMVQCNVKWLNQEANGLRHTQMAMVQNNVEWFNRGTNGLRHTQMVQCNVEWFNRDLSGGTTKQIVLPQIKWFLMTYSCWRRNQQKYKSEMDKSRLELSSLCGVWRNVLYLWHRNVFDWKKEL